MFTHMYFNWLIAFCSVLCVHAMAGVLFIICIPTEEHEKELKRKVKKKVVIQETRVLRKTMCSTFNKNVNSEEKHYLLNKETLDNNGYEAFNSSSPIKTNYENLPMEKVLENILKQLELNNSNWSRNAGSSFIHVTFTLESGVVSEEVLCVLKECGIGEKHDSIVSVIPCVLYYKGSSNETNETILEADDEEHIHEQSKNSGWSRFISTIRARLTVAEVVEAIRPQAALTFDFICLVIISTVLCAIGLVENSNLYLLSSMLISPMMGPVMAGTFGTVIRDRQLQKIGVQSELIGLGLAMVIGFFYGTTLCVFTNSYGDNGWPTIEMASRGEIHNLGVGCLIALLSGAAVALGILSDNIASLVGVAISTSLMPPAVNAGLLWSLASVYYLKGNETTRYSSLTHTNYYSDNMAAELTSQGGVSLCLTFANIICIYLAGILVFKIKEVAPIASRDKARRQFWKHDIKIARNYNKTLNKEDFRGAHEQLSNDIAECDACMKQGFNSDLLKNQLHHSTDLGHDNDKINIKRSQFTWSPCTQVSKRPTIQELKELYSNLIRDKPAAFRCLNYQSPIRTRRLSQIFIPLESDQVREVSSSNPKNQRDSTQGSSNVNFCTKSKRFVVTACSLEHPNI